MHSEPEGSRRAIEMKAFLPAKDFDISKRFYQAIGFQICSDSHGVAYMSCQGLSFLLQDFYHQGLAENLMMHLLVEDARRWHHQLTSMGLESEFGARLSPLQEQPWGMLEFCLHDPSGVLWRIAQNLGDPV